MGYYKFYYALLDFKKVVIFVYFNVMITLSMNSLTISFYILSTRFFN